MSAEEKIDVLSQRGEQIVDEAIKLLSIGGIPALTTKNLANAVGVTEPALYRHFKNKMDILAVILSRQEKNTRQLFQHSTERCTAVLDQLEYVYARIFHSFAICPSLSAIAFSDEIFRQNSQLAEQFSRIMNTAEENILTLLTSEKGQQECRTDVPPRDLAGIIMGASRLLVTRWRLSSFTFDLEKEGAQLWKSLRIVLASNSKPTT